MAVHTTMRGFSRRMREIAVGVDENTTRVMRKTVITVVAAVTLRTPVDTGRARSNWQTRIGNAPTGPVGAFAVGKQGSTGAAATAQAVAAAQAEMARLGVDDTEVYIANNLPYIKRLNEGWSDQAPAGFVQSAIMAGLNAIRKARLVR